MAIAISAIVCLAIGSLIVALALTSRVSLSSDFLLRICLSAGFGVGVFSILFFLARISGFMRLWPIDLGVLALLIAIYLWARSRRAGASVSTPGPTRSDSAPGFLTTGFLVTLLAALYSGIVRSIGHPYGSGWDSFAIWNLHARFLYRGGVHWRDGFTATIPWSHPDYPLLLPAAIAHFWTVLGHESAAVAAVIGLAFTFGTVGLLFSALDILSGRTSALLGAMALLSSPFFIELGTWQYADVPLSFFFLSTVVLFHFHDFEIDRIGNRVTGGKIALAGLTLGSAAWTKNEGVLFLCTILFTRVVIRRPRHSTASEGRSNEMRALLFPLIPMLLILACFKHFIAPPGDLFSNQASMLQKLRDPARYWAVTKWYGKEFLRFGHWLLIPIPILMIGFHFLTRHGARARPGVDVRASVLALALTLMGYFVIYLITPYDIYWHLRFSLARLFIQVWPATIFVFFLKIGPTGSQIQSGGSAS